MRKRGKESYYSWLLLFSLQPLNAEKPFSLSLPLVNGDRDKICTSLPLDMALFPWSSPTALGVRRSPPSSICVEMSMGVLHGLSPPRRELGTCAWLQIRQAAYDAPSGHAERLSCSPRLQGNCSQTCLSVEIWAKGPNFFVIPKHFHPTPSGLQVKGTKHTKSCASTRSTGIGQQGMWVAGILEDLPKGCSLQPNSQYPHQGLARSWWGTSSLVFSK